MRKLSIRPIFILRSLGLSVRHPGESRFAQQIGNLVAWWSQWRVEMLSLLRAGNPAFRVLLGPLLSVESIHDRASYSPVNSVSLNIPPKQSLLDSICDLSKGVFSEHLYQAVADGWLSTNFAITTLLKLPGWHNVSRIQRETRFVDAKASVPGRLTIMGNKA